jgi:hypothetical protein
VFGQISEAPAIATGNAISARVVAADGSVVFSCDVGTEESDAVIKLNTTKLYSGVSLRLAEFRIQMP